jgi:heme/copper-type cytochrome/quinol oxidase subunit 2
VIAFAAPGLPELIIIFLICSVPIVITVVIVIVVIIIVKNKKANTDAEETVDTTPSEQTNDYFSETDA